MFQVKIPTLLQVKKYLPIHYVGENLIISKKPFDLVNTQSNLN